MAPTRGFEPPTCRLGGGRSVLLSYVGIFHSCLYILASVQGNVKHFFARKLILVPMTAAYSEIMQASQHSGALMSISFSRVGATLARP